MIHAEWQARQADMQRTILEEPALYFTKGYTIAEFSLFNAQEMLQKDPFCFAKAWVPFHSPEDPLNIKLLRIILNGFIPYSDLDNATKFKLIDAYPFVLEEGIIGTNLPDSFIEAYHVQKSQIREFTNSAFASALPHELVSLITSML
jgi:hypothetical protein